MNMNTDARDADDEIARYLAEVAWNEPGQLPWVMVEVMWHIAMIEVISRMEYGMVSLLSQWTASLEK